MAQWAQSRLPERRRSYKFALTPLADAMFQLLIFFMLSSSLTHYSLLTLKTSPDSGETVTAIEEEGAEPAPEEVLPPGDVALWTLDHNSVIVSGQRFGLEGVDDLVSALAADGADTASVIVLVRNGARVQDVTTVLARLRAAQIGSVQVTAEAF